MRLISVLLQWFGRSPPRDDEEPNKLVETDQSLQTAEEAGPPVSEQEANKDDEWAEALSSELGSALARGKPSAQEPPSEPGIYRIRYLGPSRRIMYIGIASNLSNRKYSQTYNGRHYTRLHEFCWQQARLDATAAALIRDEKRQIKKHRPPHNVKAGGAGPMRQAIDRRLRERRVAACINGHLENHPPAMRIAVCSRILDEAVPDNKVLRAMAYHIRARAYRENGKADKAISDFRMALRESATYPLAAEATEALSGL